MLTPISMHSTHQESRPMRPMHGSRWNSRRMARTPDETPLELGPGYMKDIVQAIAAAGGQQAVGDAVGIDQATVSRNLRKPTATSIGKIVDHLHAPPAIVTPLDFDHSRWCM